MKPELFTFKFSQMPLSEQSSIFNNIKICSKQKFINNKKKLNQVNKISLKSCLNSENLFDLNFVSSKSKFKQNIFSSDSNSQTSSNQTKRSSIQSNYQNIKINKVNLKRNIQYPNQNIRDKKRSSKNDIKVSQNDDKRANIQKMNQKIKIIHELIEKQNQNIIRMGENNKIIKNQIKQEEINTAQKQNIIYNLKSQSMNSKREEGKTADKRLSADTKNIQKDSFLKAINNQKKFKYYHPKNKNIITNNQINKKPKLKYFKQNKHIRRKEESSIQNADKNIIICIQDLKTNDQKSQKSNQVKITLKNQKQIQQKKDNKLSNLNQKQKQNKDCQTKQPKRRSSWIQAVQKSVLSSTTYSQNNSKLIGKSNQNKKKKVIQVLERTQNLLGQYKEKCVSLQKQKQEIQFEYNKIVEKLNQITDNFRIPKKKSKVSKQNKKLIPKSKQKNK